MLWIIKVDVTRVMNIKKGGPNELDPLVNYQNCSIDFYVYVIASSVSISDISLLVSLASSIRSACWSKCTYLLRRLRSLVSNNTLLSLLINLITCLSCLGTIAD